VGIRIRRKAEARWQGTVDDGAGRISTGSGALDGPYSLRSRVGDEPHTNPEELIGAGHAGCFAMSLANLLAEEGHEAIDVAATAAVNLEQLDGGFSVTRIELEAVGDVPGVDEATFARLAEQAKATCPISRALAGTEITLTARLRSTV
jgi:osmotically inducible protein OsmC